MVKMKNPMIIWQNRKFHRLAKVLLVTAILPMVSSWFTAEKSNVLPNLLENFLSSAIEVRPALYLKTHYPHLKRPAK